jgi:hypothetical protein
MVRGIFRFMQADHLFRSLEPGVTEMTDRFCIAAPLPVLGRIAEALFLRRYMLALLRERNAVIQRVAESSDWQHYLEGDSDPIHGIPSAAAAALQPADVHRN